MGELKEHGSASRVKPWIRKGGSSRNRRWPQPPRRFYSTTSAASTWWYMARPRMGRLCIATLLWGAPSQDRIPQSTKEARYPELLQPGPQRLLVVGSEVGGHWHRDCEELLRLLVNARTPRAPGVLRENAPIWPKSSTWRRQSRQAFCHSWGDNYSGHPPATARPARADVKKELGNK